MMIKWVAGWTLKVENEFKTRISSSTNLGNGLKNAWKFVFHWTMFLVSSC